MVTGGGADSPQLMQQEASNRGTNFKGARSCELCRSLEELSHSFSCQLRGAGEAGGRGTQGPPQSPLPLRRAPGAAGQISPTSCFLAPQWGWRDLKPLRGKLCHSQKSPLSASAALSPPPLPPHTGNRTAVSPTQAHIRGSRTGWVGWNNQNANTVSQSASKPFRLEKSGFTREPRSKLSCLKQSSDSQRTPH